MSEAAGRVWRTRARVTVGAVGAVLHGAVAWEGYKAVGDVVTWW